MAEEPHYSSRDSTPPKPNTTTQPRPHRHFAPPDSQLRFSPLIPPHHMMRLNSLNQKRNKSLLICFSSGPNGTMGGKSGRNHGGKNSPIHYSNCSLWLPLQQQKIRPH